MPSFKKPWQRSRPDFIVLDFETGGLKPGYHEPIQVAAKAYNGRTLQPYPDGEFSSLMKPMHFDRLEPKALQVNGKTIEELQAAPDQGVVWNNFIEWVKRYHNNGDTPIVGGFNIINFDLKFVRELNKLHAPKGEETVLFNDRIQRDLFHWIDLWFEDESKPTRWNLDTLRGFFGMSKEGAHDALVDVRQTGDLIVKFLKLHRVLQKKVKADGEKMIRFEGAFAPRQLAAA